MQPVDASIIFNQELYQIDEVLKIIRRDHLSSLVCKTKQEMPAKTTHNHIEQYDGHYIKINDKTILAMAGPTNNMQLNTLLNVFNTQEPIIKTIIVLLKNEDNNQRYCANYFRKGYEAYCRDFDILIEQISINGVVVPAHIAADYENNCVNTLCKITAKSSQIQIPFKICTLPIASGETILKNESQKSSENDVKNTERIRFLLENFNEWFQYKIVAIHCEYGIKRTAILVITFFLVAEFDNIFITNNPQLTAQNIFKICQNILQQRETFNPDAVEIYSAIKLAFKLKIAREHFLQCNQLMHDHHRSPSASSQDINKPNDNKLNSILGGHEENKQVYQNENASSKGLLTNQMRRLSFWETKNFNNQTEVKKSAEQNTAQPHKDNNSVLTIKIA